MVQPGGTESTEVVSDSLGGMTSISFSVSSVSPWGEIVRNKPNFRMRQNEANCCCDKRLRES